MFSKDGVCQWLARALLLRYCCCGSGTTARMNSGSIHATKKQQHFVLVHGACHGAWCWYKVETLLKAAGHRVTSFDLTASGINPKQYNEVHSDADYFEPLIKFMESLTSEDKVILVCHSFTGIGVSMAMETFPEKIFVAVFLAALMPGPTLSLADIGKAAAAITKPPDEMDNEYGYDNGPENPPTSLSRGPKFLATYMYNLCPPQELTLATKVLRPMGLYSPGENTLTEEKYGSVQRAYILATEDLMWPENIQRYVVEHNPPGFVKDIGSDHMAMLSRPQELSSSLLQIVEYFS